MGYVLVGADYRVTGNPTTQTFSVDAGNSPDRLMIATATLGPSNDISSDKTVSVSYDGIAFTSAGKVYSNDSDGAGWVELFILFNPTAGTHDLTFSWGGSYIASSSATGYAAYSGIASHSATITKFGNESSEPTINIPCQSNDIALAFVAAGAALTGITPTPLWANNYNPHSGVGNFALMTQQTTTASSVPLGAGANGDWYAAIGLALTPTPSAPSSTKNIILGSNTPTDLRVGSAQVTSAYLGGQLIWGTGTTPPASIAPAIISDSFGNHDTIPRGVPEGYSWREDADTDPNNASIDFKNYGATNVWGQVFAPINGSANYNVRLQARDPRLYFFDGNSWTRATIPSGSNGPLNGAYYSGDYQSGNTPASVRNDGSETYSVSLSALTNSPPDAFHWWWDGMFPRITIPANTQGILVRMDMRLIPDTGYSDITGATFISNASADLFATPTTVIGPGGYNPGIPQARMKWVTGDWQHFYGTTLSVAQINTSPPSITD